MKVNGSMDGNEEVRNKRINTAYAKLWLADNRFQWAGLAAFASKQVGCTILHAANAAIKNRRERETLELSFAAAFPGAAAGVGQQAVTEGSAAYIHKQLGFGNEHLFLDIYPLHRFYMERGWKEFDAHLEKRLLTGHEQVNILQRIMYNDAALQRLLALNQYAVVTGLPPTGDAEKIELTLSAQCKAKDGLTSPFSKDKHAKLWVVEERMRFVLRAAEQFNSILSGPQRSQVEASIRTIAAGGGAA